MQTNISTVWQTVENIEAAILHRSDAHTMGISKEREQNRERADEQEAGKNSVKYV